MFSAANAHLAKTIAQATVNPTRTRVCQRMKHLALDSNPFNTMLVQC